MSKDPSSWIDYLDNRLALNNIFGGEVPALDKLVLAQFVLDAGAMYISLNFPSLPSGSPARWIAQGCDSAQLRLSFHSLFEISMTGTWEEAPDVVASFHSDKCFSMSNPVFNVRFKYEHVKADLYPYNSDIFEEPRDWYHR